MLTELTKNGVLELFHDFKNRVFLQIIKIHDYCKSNLSNLIPLSVVLSDGFAKVQSFFDGEAKKKLILEKIEEMAIIEIVSHKIIKERDNMKTIMIYSFHLIYKSINIVIGQPLNFESYEKNFFINLDGERSIFPNSNTRFALKKIQNLSNVSENNEKFENSCLFNYFLPNIEASMSSTGRVLNPSNTPSKLNKNDFNYFEEIQNMKTQNFNHELAKNASVSKTETKIWSKEKSDNYGDQDYQYRNKYFHTDSQETETNDYNDFPIQKENHKKNCFKAKILKLIIKTPNKFKKEKKELKVNVLDQDGEKYLISFYDGEAEKYEILLKEGESYVFENLRETLPKNYDFIKESLIKPYVDKDLNRKTFKFTKIQQILESEAIGNVVNVVGYISEKENLVEMNTKNGKKLKTSFNLSDSENFKIKINLWDKMAESVCLYKNAVIILINMRLSEYKSIKNLNNVHYTRISYEIDDYPEALFLFERIQKNACNQKNIEVPAQTSYAKKLNE